MDSQTPPAMATLDRCNDFKNIFANWRPNWRFWPQTKLNFTKFDHGIGFWVKSQFFAENCRKSQKSVTTRDQGCQICLCTPYQNGQNIPNDHKIYQIAIPYSKQESTYFFEVGVKRGNSRSRYQNCEKIALKATQYIFWQNQYVTFTVDKIGIIVYLIFKTTARSKQSPNGWKSAQSGHPVHDSVREKRCSRPSSKLHVISKQLGVSLSPRGKTKKLGTLEN
jgi:hypothetical protein